MKEVGYVPLQAEIYQLSYERFLQGKQGSLFANRTTVGADLRTLLKEDQQKNKE